MTGTTGPGRAIAFGSWVEYDVVDAPQQHPKNCLKRAINIDMDFKVSKAPTTDEFGDKPMNVRDFNKVDYFQFDSQGDGNLTHKSTIRRNFANDTYYNKYYGEVIISRDSRNRLIEFNINEVDVMMNFISSEKYCGAGPHWEVTHFINLGKMYSINGFLSIRGFVLRGPGGVVRNRRDVYIPPDSLRPVGNPKDQKSSNESEKKPMTKEPLENGFKRLPLPANPVNQPPEPSRGLGGHGGAMFGAAAREATQSMQPREEVTNDTSKGFASSGFGGQQTSTGFASSGFGGQQTSTGFASSGFGGQKASTGFGGPPKTPTGFGGPKTPTGFGSQKASTGFGGQQTTAGLGGPKTPTGFGVQQAPNGFGTSTGFGAPKTPTGFGSQKASAGGHGRKMLGAAAIGVTHEMLSREEVKYETPKGFASSGFPSTGFASSGFGCQQSSTGFGGQQTSTGFGGSKTPTGFGGQQTSAGFGGQRAPGTFGNASAENKGPSQQNSGTEWKQLPRNTTVPFDNPAAGTIVSQPHSDDVLGTPRGTAGRRTTDESPTLPIDSDFECTIDKPKESDDGNLYDDNWGDSLPTMIQPSRSHRSRGTGLAKYGQSHF
uniref:Peptidase S59 domain-containing protein n=1 Tax=Caenorhabditis tropicalis TaxID=1561998 RepID=A0A1I7TU30_9PELO